MRFHRARLALALTVEILFTLTVGVSTAGEPAHELDFEALALDGGIHEARSLLGKVVLLDFWAVWCPPCVGAIPKLNALDEELASRGFEVLGIALHSGGPGDVRDFVEEHGATYTIAVGDEDLAERFGVIGFPTYFLLDREGRVHQKYVGDMERMHDELRADIETLLATE